MVLRYQHIQQYLHTFLWVKTDGLGFAWLYQPDFGKSFDKLHVTLKG